MLEIIVIVILTRKLASIASGKGRSGGWAALGPVLWIAGEVVGFIVGMILWPDVMMAWLCGILGAAVGGAVSWVIVANLSAAPGWEGMQDVQELGQGSSCPSCGSVQTERQGFELVCFNCNARTPAVVQPQPNWGGAQGGAPGQYPQPPPGYYPQPGQPPAGYPQQGQPQPGLPPQPWQNGPGGQGGQGGQGG